MPKPRLGEKRDSFLERCIPIVIEDGAASSREQAVAICSSMFEENMNKEQHYKEVELDETKANKEDFQGGCQVCGFGDESVKSLEKCPFCWSER